MADLSEAWFWALNLGAAVIGGGWFAFRWMHVARVIEDTPTSRVRSAAQGYVELEGRARPLAGTLNLAPMTQRDCVWWRYRVQHRRRFQEAALLPWRCWEVGRWAAGSP